MNQLFFRFKKEEIIRQSWRIIFLVLLFCLPVSSLSQKYYFDTYGVEQGLNSSKVYFILQDQNDYLWLGTEGGISKFDGTRFYNYSPEDSLADDGVYCIYEEPGGNIWFGHLNGGLSFFNGEEFQEMKFDSIEIIGDITSIQAAGDNSIWISTSGSGIYKLSGIDVSETEIEVKQYKGSEGLSDQVFATSLTNGGNYYCLTDVGVKIYNPSEDIFENFNVPGLTQYWIKTCMFEDSRGNMYFGTYNGGLYQYLKDQDTMIIYDNLDIVKNNFITSITEDREGNIWVGTFGGGITVLKEEGVSNYDVTNGLNDNEIKCIVEDKEGNIIVGTQTQGISIFKGSQFTTLDTDDGLENEDIWAIQQTEEGTFWLGTNEGISVYDPLRPTSDKFTIFNRENSKIPGKIRFIKEDKNDILWIGTDGGGVIQYDIKERRFINDTYLNRNLYRDKIVKALEVDKNNNIWIGTNAFLAFWDPVKKEGAWFTQSDGLAGNGITSLFVDKSGNLWIGSDRRKGLTYYNIEKDEFKIVDLGIKIVPTSIAEDNNGKIWLGTTNGVYAWDRDTIVYHLTEKSGLLTNIVELIIVDDNNDVYIGTNKGLNRYSQKDSIIYTYGRKNGFTGIESRDNAVFKDLEGKIWFGTANGVMILNPDKIRAQVVEPLTHIASMRVNFQNRAMTPGLKLTHKEKSIIFDYYSICLTNPEAVEYQIILEGADEDWQPVTIQTEAIYSALAPGKYIFKVKAKNSFGTWNEEPASYEFTILPPFYQRWWFILTSSIVLVLIIFGYIKVREQALRRENQILEEKVALRTEQVVQKSEEIEQKNKDITDSIRYAKRIQNAILPPEDSLKNSFILFKPKDIVSGDFYWLTVDGSKQFIAAVDCTGHGVPGAFMSIIGYNSLNKIVKEYGFTNPADILDHLNDEVVNTLQKQAEAGEVKDGMDLSLIVYDMKKNELEFAGAYNPLYLIRNKELIVTKADRFAIGWTSSDSGQKFTSHKIKLEKGDTTYIFSDGFADQFGGEKGKKFMIRNLKKLLLDIQDLSMEEQKSRLEETFEKWRGNEEQIDDVIIIGTRYE